MVAKVFISCGQADKNERKVAADVREWLESMGFEVFVALETQSLNDINYGTISHLRRSDYYLFIDFPRERILARHESITDPPRYRGSVFTHQELALAYLLDFPDSVFLKHKDVELRGIAQFQMANAQEFSDYAEILPYVKVLVTGRSWDSKYSRHLVADNCEWSLSPIRFSDHTGTMDQHVCFVKIHNRRKDVGAISATTRLIEIVNPDGCSRPSPDTSDLKWAGQPGFARTIRPNDSETISALALDMNNPSRVYLHSAADVRRCPIIDSLGEYVLTYQVFSQEFPIMEFKLRLNITGDYSTTNTEFI